MTKRIAFNKLTGRTIMMVHSNRQDADFEESWKVLRTITEGLGFITADNIQKVSSEEYTDIYQNSKQVLDLS